VAEVLTDSGIFCGKTFAATTPRLVLHASVEIAVDDDRNGSGAVIGIKPKSGR
jgi:hypothetical protein